MYIISLNLNICEINILAISAYIPMPYKFISRRTGASLSGKCNFRGAYLMCKITAFVRSGWHRAIMKRIT